MSWYYVMIFYVCLYIFSEMYISSGLERSSGWHGCCDALRRDCQWQVPGTSSCNHASHLPSGREGDGLQGRLIASLYRFGLFTALIWQMVDMWFRHWQIWQPGTDKDDLTSCRRGIVFENQSSNSGIEHHEPCLCLRENGPWIIWGVHS